MADKLIIVESPAKANTIKKFLGGSTKVVASMGHIRDLPKSKMGIDIEHDFEPEYINIRGKGDLIKSLKKDAKQAKQVYIATDPDREGEAIAWHLAYILNEEKAKIRRVTFNEITKTAVQKAIKVPREIDNNVVDAQQARRVLDRIVGYKIVYNGTDYEQIVDTDLTIYQPLVDTQVKVSFKITARKIKLMVT